MAYTQANLDAVRAARVSLATNARVVSVSMNGRTVTYAAADDDKLQQLERDISNALAEATTTGRTRQVLISTVRGL